MEVFDNDDDSDTEESYSSDDDEAHVAHHYHKKKHLKKKKKAKGNNSTSSSLFKPHEIDHWDDDQIDYEQAAMLKHLSELMMGAVSAVDQEKNAIQQQGGGGGGADGHMAKSKSVSTAAAVIESNISGMTHKRAHTLRALLDVTQSPAKGHETKESLSRKFSVGDLTSLDVEDEYDPEIFKYLTELVGSNENHKHIPLTPSTSKMMRDLFHDVSNDGDEDSQSQQQFKFEHSQSQQSGHGRYPSTGGYSHGHSPQYSGSISSVSELPKSLDDEKEDEDVIESLEQGTTLVYIL